MCSVGSGCQKERYILNTTKVCGASRKAWLTKETNLIMKNSLIVSICIAICAVFVGCHPTPGPDKAVSGAILGAGWGAGAGAVVGNQVDASGAGAAIGSGFGLVSGLIQGASLDIAEGTELEQQRDLDALRVRVAANQRSLQNLQSELDRRDQKLYRSASGGQVYFDKNRASLRSGSAEQLQRLAEQIKFNPYVGRISVQGHSDDTGNTERNLRLSEARARTVVSFFVQQGISIDKIDVQAHGGLRPLATNETESGRQLNRRVEIVLEK